MSRHSVETLLTGLAFPEAPRWRDGRLWFTDQHAREVRWVDPHGQSGVVATLDDLPGGLGWLPDGSLLVVAMTERRIYRLGASGLELYADLADLASFHCNDMVLDADGRAYVGNFGYDLHGGEAVRPAELVRVDPDGARAVAATGLIFPNGCVIDDAGERLILAETFAHRLTAFRRAPDGTLHGRALWANLGEATPDGICLDREGAVWVASPGTGEVMRVLQGGAVSDRIRPRGAPYACMLGGEEGRTLFICSSETDDPEAAAARRTGRIEWVEVKVAGAGRP